MDLVAIGIYELGTMLIYIFSTLNLELECEKYWLCTYQLWILWNSSTNKSGMD